MCFVWQCKVLSGFGEIANTDPGEFKENIPSIIDVQRIIVKRNNVEVKINMLILTFNSPKIP